jgi:hypothetical protein
MPCSSIWKGWLQSAAAAGFSAGFAGAAAFAGAGATGAGAGARFGVA